MRKNRALVIVGVALVALAFAAAAGAADSLTARSTILPDNVHITGTYRIQAPAGCPVVQPSYNNTAATNRWLSPHCQKYEEQSADFKFVVRLNGRAVYEDSTTGFGSFTNPMQGGTFDERIYAYELPSDAAGRCVAGTYYWTITLIDPYYRSAYNTSARGSFTCGRH